MSGRTKAKSEAAGARQPAAKAAKGARAKAPARPRKAGAKPEGTKQRPDSGGKAGAERRPEAPSAKAVCATRAGKAAKAKRPAKAADAPKRKNAPKRKRKTRKVGGFAVGDHVVYPAHGVGRITAIDEQAVADQTLQMFVVAFEKDKMTLMVPTAKIESAGMRRLSSRETMDTVLSTLRGRARLRRVMWSRRAQEYEAKLNSGDPVAIAEVLRDLHRNAGQPDPSYSERQMYEAALDRLAREFAAVEKTDTEQAASKLEDVLRAA